MVQSAYIQSVVDNKCIASFQNQGDLESSPIFQDCIEEPSQNWIGRYIPTPNYVKGRTPPSSQYCNGLNVCLTASYADIGALVVQDQSEPTRKHQQWKVKIVNYPHRPPQVVLINGFDLCLTRSVNPKDIRYITVTHDTCIKGDPSQIFFFHSMGLPKA